MLIVLTGCPTPTTPNDAADVTGEIADDVQIIEDTGVDTGPDPHMGLRLARCEDTEPMGPTTLTPVASTLLGTIEPTMMAVAMPDTAANPVFEMAELNYRARGFDQYRRGPAQTRVQRTELGGGTTFTTRKSIAYFVHMSDTQLVDDESPSRLAGVESPDVSGGIRPQEAYLPRATSAMNRTLAALERPERPFLFGVFAGDCSDSAQANELQWFMQLMNGVPGLHTDSAIDDDPVPGPGNDPKDPFDPVAFPAPWYFVPGNHDLEVVGVAALSENSQMTAIGTNASTGTRDYTTWWAAPRRGRVPADPNRRQNTRADVVRGLREGPAMPGPVGHGFPAMPVEPSVALGANYVSDVVPGLIRMIALDTSDDTGGSPGLVHRATIDGFLRPELERAQTDGMLVMLSSHHATGSIDRRSSEIGAMVADAVDPTEIEQLVAGYPNVITWLVGHNHQVRVRPIRGADTAHPGYWEVQSSSIADHPSQSRVVEIVNNGNGTLSIFGTMIDFDANDCMERRFRRLAMMDNQSGWSNDHTGTAMDRNVELVIPIPAAAATRISAASATAPTRIESETTLRGMR